ncbi:glycosyltransferase [Mariprofundus sp. KV]|uniref:glycosyltransferase n=1 Tax=Mariprofundus sp. KV TaxID=2608715 RepID=UPI0015A441BD|nr:glycosyltransferase [Mariprofundus sp. KV]NWF35547.1 glycosyltransferase family 4 protein [Mariprofundus sp. KV]
MPTLLVDATTLSVNPKGVGKYAYEVISRLDRMLPSSWMIRLIVFREVMPPLNWSARLTKIEVEHQSDLQLGLITVPAVLRSGGGDLFLRLCDCVGRKYPVPTITVCHDINELIARAQKTPLSIPRKVIYGVKEHFRIRAIQASDFVVCNSEFTRRECVSRYGICDEKSAIGYCGISGEFYDVCRAEAVVNIRNLFGCEDYILSFATGDPRENYAVLPEVIAATRQQGMTMPFVIAGVRENHAYVRELRERLTQHALVEGSDFIFVPFLGGENRQRLCELYAAASFYLELSLHEGFGMQLAEAMACGVQCLAPNHSALTEVGGAFVCHIDPTDAVSIAEVLVDAVNQQLHLQDHGDQIEYTRQFSWDHTASVIAAQVEMLSGKVK